MLILLYGTTTGKTIALIIQIFVSKVMSLLFNKMFSFVIAFLPRNKPLLTSWLIDGEVMETVREFIFLGSKVTADGDCSHEIKICLFLGRKAVTNLDNILKSRDITLLTKVHLLKAMVYAVVVYGSES